VKVIRRLATINKRILGVPFWHFWAALLELTIVLGGAAWLFWWIWQEVNK